MKTLPVPADNPPPDGATLPAGLVDYDVQVANPGDNADVKLYLPDGQQSSVYMLQNNAWQKFDDHAKVDDANNQVTLQLQDGGAGDGNGTDAVIHDPVGVATPPPPTTTEAPTTTTEPPTTTTEPPTTTTAPPAAAAAPPDDNDGVPVDVENGAPNGGDGNHDGVLDSTQANVASLPAAVDVNGDGVLNDYVTIVSPDGTSLQNVTALPVPTDNPPPSGVTLPVRPVRLPGRRRAPRRQRRRHLHHSRR